MSADSTTNQREIADDIEDFMPNEFVGESEWLLAQHRIATHDHGVFQAPTLDQILVHQRLDVFVVNERPRRRDLALKNFRYDIGGHELGEAIVRSRLGTRNSEPVIVWQK